MSPDALIAQVIAARAAATPDRLLVVGLCGAQGSGKSTLTAQLAHRLDRAAVLSLDDLYLTRAERVRLAGERHPLLRTRGVPGTHDVALGVAVLDALARGEATALPRFDKATDDRADPSTWPVAPVGTRVLLFEGWCVGAAPQAVATLAAPVNALERDQDADAAWRTAANAALAGSYRALFDRIDLQLLLAAPGWDVVLDWRLEQERGLRARVGGGGSDVMDEAAVARFVSHYERLTRHVLDEMPGRADIVVALDAARIATRVTLAGAALAPT